MSPRSLLKTFLGYKSGKRLGKDLFAFQGGRERICNDKFSKVNVLRKGVGGGQESIVRKKPFQNSVKLKEKP